MMNMNRYEGRGTQPSRLDGINEMLPAREGVVLPCALGRQSWSGPPHHHNELEVNLVMRGHASYLIGGRRYDIGVQTLLWIFPNQPHLLFEHSNDFMMWIAVFRPQLVDRYQGDLMGTEAPALKHWNRTLNTTAHRALQEQFKALHDTAWNNTHYDLGLAWLLVTCKKVFDDAHEGVEGESVHPTVSKAAHALRHEGMNWNLEQLARHVGASTSWLSRLFQQQMGVSLTDFRNRQRFEKFRALYGSGRRRTLSQAAFEAGFGSYAQFHRVTQSLTGLSPREWSQALESGA